MDKFIPPMSKACLVLKKKLEKYNRTCLDMCLTCVEECLKSVSVQYRHDIQAS